jgi:uncharacterized protein (DUF1697 family)
MGRFIGLLRGINVGGRTRVPMAELRALCGELGWTHVETYIQSGNVVFDSRGAAARLETRLEKAVEARFGAAIPVMVRPAATWHAIVAANPFTAASEREPGRVLVGVAKRPLKPDAAAALEARAAAGEQVRQAGGALWFHYPQGVGRSKLSPSLIDRLTGSPVTARNWRTMLRLQEMLA